MDNLAVFLLGVAALLVMVILVYWMDHVRRMNVAALAAERHRLVGALRQRQYDLRSAYANSGRLQARLNEMQETLEDQTYENAELKEQVGALERESASLRARVTATAQTLAERDAIIVNLKQQADHVQVAEPAPKQVSSPDNGQDPSLVRVPASDQAEAPGRVGPLSKPSAEVLRALLEPKLTIAKLEAQVAEQHGRAEMLAERLKLAESTLTARDELVHHLAEQLARVSGDTQQLTQQVLAAEKNIAERDHSITALLERLNRVFDLLEDSRQQVVASRRVVADLEVADERIANPDLSEESTAQASESQ